jgi:threonylcarbamoyladenosine tRNA methylthiotransferase MtaB
MRIAFTTLGCKINQYETERMRVDLVQEGNTIVPFDDDADVYIINTCSVTAKADSQCRRIIRTAAERHPGARIVVTGCYAETQADEIKKIPNISLVMGNSFKSNTLHHLGHQPAAKHHLGRSLITVQERTRAFLKIQDGCDNYCSYCSVPFARGRSRSVEPQDVLREFDRLVQAGYPEIVLTGIHIGVYGNDLAAKYNLTNLLASLCDRKGDTRIRLSSIEPNEVTDGIIDLIGKGVCRHLHIPLQSGDDGILAVMNRKYTSHFYRELLDRIVRQVPGMALGADVMVGFPGEDERAFQNTVDLIQNSPLTHLHVFSYSRRPGTVAAGMKHQVPEQVKKERNELLRAMGAEKSLLFRNNNTEKKIQVIVEDKQDSESGLFTGLTDNYIRVKIQGAVKEDVGTKIVVMIKKIEHTENYAEIYN